MKRCPECRKDYLDDSLLYCLDDGAALLEGPASGGTKLESPALTGDKPVDEPQTAILSEPGGAAATGYFQAINSDGDRAVPGAFGD